LDRIPEGHDLEADIPFNPQDHPLMNVLIVGAGAVGYHLASRLSDEAQSVTVLDPDPTRVRVVADNLDVLALRGSGSNLEQLVEAGIDRMDLVAAVSGVDEVNLLACLVASRFGVPRKIARVRRPHLHGPDSRVPAEALGVDFFISPVRDCAREIFELLDTPWATDVARFAEDRVELIGMRVSRDSPLCGHSVEEVDRELQGPQFVLAALVREGETRIPTGSTRFEDGDKVLVLAPTDDLEGLSRLHGSRSRPIRRVMIAGGSSEAVHLTRLLRAKGVQCTLLVRSIERARELAEGLPGALVLRGDPTDLELLEMEGVEGVDGFVALSERDEVNMLVALLGKSLGARRVITLVHKPEYMNLVERVGLDAAVSPRISAANAVLRFIRSESVSSVATVAGSAAQALDVVVEPGSALAGSRVRDIPFPSGALLGVLVREGEIILPRGDDSVEPGDHAIFFVLPGALSAMERLIR
jgi:trk system potassium uptake protein